MQDARPSPRSLALLTLFWAILQLGGLWAPGLLDDVDSIYIEIAREMLHRHDYITPYIDGVRFFDKPPLMYWLAAGSMRLFGEHDWAARIPIALAMLGLLFAVYALGLRLYRQASPAAAPDRGAFYAALALATAIGPYLYTRFFIPDILICLWMTLSLHAFLIALDRVSLSSRKALLPTVSLAVTLALNLLTKGLIGLVFPLGFIVLYATLTQQWPLVRRLPLAAPLAAFLAVALPWHLLAALRNPAIPVPPGLGLPARAGWAWFYLYNEHVARFLGRRIPHDYGQTPVWLFLVYALLWIAPWAAYLPAIFARLRHDLGHRYPVTIRAREAALTVTLWAATVLVFFSLSSRQEYYSLPALPALALALGGTLALAERQSEAPTLAEAPGPAPSRSLAAALLACHTWLLLPIAILATAVCLYFAVTAPTPAPGTDLSALLAQNPELYNLSLGHLFDLTGAAMGLFREPLVTVAAGMLLIGPLAWQLRRRARPYPANLTLAAGMTLVLLAAHQGLVRFNPILGSKPLADAILAAQQASPGPPGRILLDGELTSGSTLLFYTRQPVTLVNGRVNGPWFGGFWPDAPPIFATDQDLHTLWSSPTRIFLLTYNPAQRTQDLGLYAPVHILASAGGKTILSNR